MKKLSDEIREAIDRCGETRYAICKALGLSESTLSKFMSAERGLSMSMLDRIAKYLDLHISTGKNRGRK